MVGGEGNLCLGESFGYQPPNLVSLCRQPMSKVTPFVNRPTGLQSGIYDKWIRTYIDTFWALKCGHEISLGHD